MMWKKHTKSRKLDENYFTTDRYRTYRLTIGVLWGVLTICYFILLIVCLIQPYWFGRAPVSLVDNSNPNDAYFGLYQYCYAGVSDTGIQSLCRGYFLDFNEILSPSFSASAVLVGLSTLLILVCLILFLLFICFNSAKIYLICGITQAIVAFLMFLAIIIYPSGWSHEVVRRFCRSTAYSPGDCHVQWAYILAILGFFDGGVLAILALILSKYHMEPLRNHDRNQINGDKKSLGSGAYVESLPNLRYDTKPKSIRDDRSVASMRSNRSKMNL